MANRYLVCALYLISMQTAAMAGGYSKDGPALTIGEKVKSMTDPQSVTSPDKDTTKTENSSVVTSGEIGKHTKQNNDDQYRNQHSFLNAGVHNSYPEGYGLYSGLYHSNYGAYPGHSDYSGSPSGYPTPSSLYPGFAGINTPPISSDYVSRYQGPGTVHVVLPDGTLADTLEVIAARAAHLTALQKAQALWYGPNDDGSYNLVKYGDVGGYPTPGSTGPIASLPDGLHSAGHFGPFPTGYQGPLAPGASVTGYQGPLAMPVVLPSGYLADTAEVVAARLAHLTAVIRANEQHATLWRTNDQSVWK